MLSVFALSFRLILPGFFAASPPPPPLSSLHSYCDDARPVVFSLKSGVPVDEFWKTYEEKEKTRRRNEILIFEITQPKHVHIAIFSSLRRMNKVLDRPTSYLMNGRKVRDHHSMVSPKKEKDQLDQTLGHDVEESLLREFAARLADEEPKMTLPDTAQARQQLCLEASFWKDFLWPTLLAPGKMILIAASTQTSFKTTVSHEMHHALFYADPRLQGAVADYWDLKVSTADQQKIEKILQSHGYQTAADAKLLHNEFLAYLLQIRGGRDVLEEFVLPYAEELRAYLEAKRIDLPRI